MNIIRKIRELNFRIINAAPLIFVTGTCLADSCAAQTVHQRGSARAAPLVTGDVAANKDLRDCINIPQKQEHVDLCVSTWEMGSRGSPTIASFAEPEASKAKVAKPSMPAAVKAAPRNAVGPLTELVF